MRITIFILLVAILSFVIVFALFGYVKILAIFAIAFCACVISVGCWDMSGDIYNYIKSKLK